VIDRSIDFGNQGVLCSEVSSPLAKGAYCMLADLEIKNFRCFEHVNLKGLTRVNVITGANGAGKSAFLEALLLGVRATADAVTLINQLRALPITFTVAPFGGPMVLPPEFFPQARQSISGYAGHLFRTKKGDGKHQTIQIGYTDSNKVKYEASFSFSPSTAGQTQFPVLSPEGTVQNPLMVERRKVIGGRDAPLEKFAMTVHPSGALQQTAGANHLGPTTFIIGSTTAYSDVENVIWFSRLKETKSETKLVSFLKEQFPFLNDIQILSPDGTPSLYAIMADSSVRRLTLISAGLTKIITMLLACANNRGGVILIDELENGIFYEKYEHVWRILYEFALDTENQIFISTHSDECLRALPPVMEKASDFCQLRMERRNGDCSVRQITGTAMKAALHGHNEVRGATIGPKVHH
jgi:archaellum biogenesis ATPase FlaH